MGAGHQLPQFLDRLRGALLHHAAGRERRRQHLAQTGVTGLEFAQVVHQAPEALPRVGRRERPVDRFAEPRDVALEGGRGQVRASRKPPVQRRDADAGATCHFVERCRDPTLGEQFGGGVKDAVAVELSVSPQPPGGFQWPRSLPARACAGNHTASIPG